MSEINIEIVDAVQTQIVSIDTSSINIDVSVNTSPINVEITSGGAGQTGRSGYSGYSGVDGVIGHDGVSGYSGFSGQSITGPTGPQGLSGYSGFSGLQGGQGNAGSQGQSGFSGKSGYSGFSGTSITGSSGFSGYSGQGNALLVGAVGGQTAIGGLNSGENLTLESTANATKGKINLGVAGNSYFDEANNFLKLVSNALGASTVINSGTYLSNNTAAALGAQQISPAITLESHGWATTGSTSQVVQWAVVSLPVQGAANPTGNLIFLSQVNGGVLTARFAVASNGMPSGTTSQGLYCSDGISQGGISFVSQAPSTGRMRTGMGWIFEELSGIGTAGTMWSWIYPNSTAAAGSVIMHNFSTMGGVGFIPSTGSATYTTLSIADVINQTGSASGITRGLYINPTLTSAVDYRALEIATGKAILQALGLGGSDPGTNVILKVAAGTTSKAQINLASSTAPTSPNDGDIWYDGTNLKMRAGGSTQNVIGVSGFSGYSGATGSNGSNGTSGFSGYSGLSGYSGFSGVSGYSGFSGKSGFSGFSGNGTSGFSGYSGASYPVLLASGTATNQATLDIDMSAYYNLYKIIEIELISFLPVTDAVSLMLRVSANGTTYDAGATDYRYAGSVINDGASASTPCSTGDTSIIMNSIGTLIGNVSNTGYNSIIRIFNAGVATFKPQIMYDATYWNDTSFNNLVRIFGSGVRNTAQLTKAIRLLFFSGNISTGIYRVIGYA